MTNLAVELLERRRAGAMSPGELARRADVSVDDVMLAEAGGEPRRDAAERLCAVLRLPPETVLDGMPHGWLRPVEPLDAAHASRLATLSAAATGPGWLVAPDVVAHDRETLWTRGRQRVLGIAWPVADAAAHLVAIPTMIAAVAGVGGMVAAAFFAVLGGAFVMFGNPDAGSALGGALTFLVGSACLLGVAAAVGSVGYGLSRAVGRWLPWTRADSDGWGRRESMAGEVYLVTAECLSVVSASGAATLRKDLPPTGFRSVGRKMHGDGHVTVTIGHEGGETVLPWLPRSRDLDAVVEAWEPVPRPERAPFGRSYVVGPAPSLAGPQ